MDQPKQSLKSTIKESKRTYHLALPVPVQDMLKKINKPHNVKHKRYVDWSVQNIL